MPFEFNEFGITRRGVFALVAGASASRLFAASDFWNKKDPKDWTRDDIERLTTNSPWAKPVTAQMDPNRDGTYSSGSPQGYPGGGGGGTSSPRIGLGIPGLGIPGIGGGYPGGGYPSGGGRRGGPGGQGAYSARGTVLWESAEPVMEALKPEFPEEFADHYVITLSGIPWPPRNYRPDDDDERSQQDELDRLKSVTFLKPERGNSAQPGLVKQPISSSVNGSILFGFSKDLIHLSADDKQIDFTTRLGKSPIQVRFVPKEMMYRGKFSV
jgi:hypothetical protein